MTLQKKTTQMNIWRESLIKAKTEKEAQMKKIVDSGKMYDKMVSDAVGLITVKITEEIKGEFNFHNEKDGIVTINVYRVLVITPELKLYTGCTIVPRNPQTGKQYFYDLYSFKDEEMVAKFFDDVKEQLPDEIEFTERIITAGDILKEGSRAYNVQVKFDLNS